MNKKPVLKGAITRCLALFILSTVVFNACSPATTMTATWKDQSAAPKTYNNLFVVALGKNLANKKTFEDKMSKALTGQGAKVTQSTSVFPPDMTRENIDREKLLAKFREAGCEGIVSIALVDKNAETRYVPGTTTYYAPMGMYRNWWGYYGGMGPYMYDPGYYTTDKTYYIETNLYDVNTEKLVWSGQSETLNPSNLDKNAEEFANIVVAKMVSDGVIQAKPAAVKTK